ncbi:unnamed protein product, partial [Callosobruchus maculatus]
MTHKSFSMNISLKFMKRLLKSILREKMDRFFLKHQSPCIPHGINFTEIICHAHALLFSKCHLCYDIYGYFSKLTLNF